MKISLITRGFYEKKDLFCQIIVFSIRECIRQTVLFISTDQLGKSVQNHSQDPQSDAIEYEKKGLR